MEVLKSSMQKTNTFRGSPSQLHEIECSTNDKRCFVVVSLRGRFSHLWIIGWMTGVCRHPESPLHCLLRSCRKRPRSSTTNWRDGGRRGGGFGRRARLRAKQRVELIQANLIWSRTFFSRAAVSICVRPCGSRSAEARRSSSPVYPVCSCVHVSLAHKGVNSFEEKEVRASFGDKPLIGLPAELCLIEILRSLGARRES